MVKNGFKLSPPWVTYWKQLEALFAGDPEIEVGQLYDLEDGRKEIWIYVTSEKKYRALSNLLPTYPNFGNVKVKNVLKFKGAEPHNDFEDLKDLFGDNPRVAEIKECVDFLNKVISVDSVNHSSLLDSFHLRRWAAEAVHADIK